MRRTRPGRPSGARAGRRSLVVVLALTLAPPATTLAPPAAGAVAAAPSLRLMATGGGVSQADLPLAGRLSVPVDGGRRTATLRTSGFSMAGVTWTGARAPGRVAIRWPSPGGGWGRW